jgi:hypothetical protein
LRCVVLLFCCLRHRQIRQPDGRQDLPEGWAQAEAATGNAGAAPAITPEHSHTHTHARTHTHAYTHAHARTRTHARPNTHAHTRTHTFLFGAHTDPRRLSLSGHSQRCAAVRLHRCGAMVSSGRAAPRAAGADGVLRADRCDTPRIPSAQEKVPSPSVVPEVHKFAHVSIADLKPGKNNVAVAVVVSGHSSPVDPTDPS